MTWIIVIFIMGAMLVAFMPLISLIREDLRQRRVRAANERMRRQFTVAGGTLRETSGRHRYRGYPGWQTNPPQHHPNYHHRRISGVI